MPAGMKHLSFLLCILSLSLNLAAFCTGDEEFVFSGFAGANLTLDGTATVTPSGLIELTNGTVNLKGHAFYPTPLHFRKSPTGTVQSFSVSFVFGIISVYRDLSAHGMAFFVAPSKNFSTALPAQYLGLLSDHNIGNTSNRIFAVELDTIQNNEFQDINNNHVGIDVNDLHSLKSYYAGYYDDKTGVFENLTLISREAMQVWVDYDAEATLIKVTLAPLKVARPIRPLISTTCNLSTVLTEPSYIGFSSATLGINSRHYVLGWSFGMNGLAPTIDTRKLPRMPRVGPRATRSVLFKVIPPIATTAFILAVAIVATLFVRRQRRYAELHEDWEVEFRVHRFSYKDLFIATNGFKSNRLVGVGGFGKVYRGVLPSSKLEVAVKRMSHGSRQGMKEFIAEVVSIGRLRHRNLVQLFGYCRRKGELLLVYDYMSNGSLDRYLHCEEDDLTLDWAHRFRIIKGVACGLLYLHEKWEKVVIHRDIKASNVLLDEQMNGRLGDFGLARLYDHGTDLQTTHVVGTLGYLAPELVRTGKASPLTDVFAFGTFLLEVTCGRRPIMQSAQGNQVMLVDLVLEHWHNGLLTEIVDKRLQGDCNIDEVCLVLKLGLCCSHPFTSARPSMRQVMQYLDGDMPLPELTPTHVSLNVLSYMQTNELMSSSIMSYPQLTTTSLGTMPSLSEGR